MSPKQSLNLNEQTNQGEKIRKYTGSKAPQMQILQLENCIYHYIRIVE